MSEKACFHCHEKIPDNVKILAKIGGESKAVCCHGCKAVAEFIDEQGYCDFYEYRGDSLPASKAEVAEKKWQVYDEPVNFDSFVTQLKDNHYKVSINLEGMYCSACGWLIDKHLRGLIGIFDVRLNTITKVLQAEFDAEKIKLSEILSAINRLGYKPTLSKDKNSDNQSIAERRSALKRLIVAGLGMMFIMTLSVPIYGGEYHGIDEKIYRFFVLVSLLVATLVYFYSGKTFLQNAFRDLSNKHLGMDVPVALSMSLAYFASTWNVLTNNGETIYYDSMVMFIFFLLAGRFVEMTVRHQGMSANEALGNMIPTSVMRFSADTEELMPLEQIKKGDILKVKSGEIVAIDGQIISGSGKVDESMITGESKSIAKQIDDEVMAGSLLTDGEILIKSTAIGDDTILAGLSQLLENAQLQKPKTLLLVDKIAAWFVAIVLIIATLTAIYYSIYAPDKTMLIVLSVLVATCPCALSLATPVALTAASVKLMKQGILSRSLDAITKVSKVKNWFFDKTGTLTEPTMSLVKVHNLSDKSDTEILELTAALEHESSHPIASAFNDYYNPKIQVAEFENKSGQGVMAKIDGIQYKAGNKEWCGENNHQILTQYTLVYLYKNNHAIAAFELDNQLRHDSKNQIKYLQSKGYQLAIVSGDKHESVAKTASNLDISLFYAEQTPEQKINLIHASQQQSQPTVMVGDGINDAPVLAKADVSISFNQGTQLARAASDMIMMGSSLSSIKSLILTGNKTNKIIRQNIIWALFYNLSVTPLAIMGYLAPWMAAIGMSISSLVVVLNAKRLLLK